MLCRLAAADTGICEVVLHKGNATGFDTAGNVLEFFLTSRFATPHCFDVAFLVCGDIEEFLTGSTFRTASRRIEMNFCIAYTSFSVIWCAMGEG